jgi:DNA ligase-1
MRAFAGLCDAIAATPSKTQKLSLVAAYFQSLVQVGRLGEAAWAAVFLSGRAFPAHEETILNVGGALLSNALEELSGATRTQISAGYRRYGDLGSAAEELLSGRNPLKPEITLKEVEAVFRSIASVSGPASKRTLVRGLLERAAPIEVKYIIKIMSGDLRIGLRESLVEEAIAKAFAREYASVRRANMLLGDIGATLRFAAGDRLGEARMRLFHPLGIMLASPVQTAEEAFASFTEALVEDKYDGIRAQAHFDGAEARIFSRTLDDITSSFPDVAEALRGLSGAAVLDGEILAWDSAANRALPFTEIQQRIGRKQPDAALIHSVPVAYVVFDMLFEGTDLMLDHPLRERGRRLDEMMSRCKRMPPFSIGSGKRDEQAMLFAPSETEVASLLPATVLRAPAWRAHTSDELATLFEAALSRGNEGLMIKDPASLYSPGRRGKSWLKLKRELATLDVVVTAVEFGHGKRAQVLSDYTFAVRDGEELKNVGKAYSGLTDAEILEMTSWFKANTITDFGHSRTVKPEIILEVAFNAVMESERHESGYALRFPRILRIRNDKPLAEIDTVERVREIFLRQHQRAG